MPTSRSRGARDLEDLRQPEAAADLDELTSRDDHLAARRQGAQGQNRGTGVVVHDGRRLGARHLSQQPRHARGPPPPLTLLELELEVAVSPGHGGDGLDGFLRQRGPAQAGVEQDAGRVDHGPERAAWHSWSIAAARPARLDGIDGGGLASSEPGPGLLDRRAHGAKHSLPAAA